MVMYGETFYGRHTAQHQLQKSKVKAKKDCLWKQRTHKITKIRDSVWLSLFTCNTVICEAAYAPYRRLKRYSIFKINRMGSMIPKEIKYNLHYDDVRGDFTAATRHNTSYSRVKLK